MDEVFSRYSKEGLPIPYTMADFRKDVLKQYSPKERLADLTLEERLADKSPEEIRQYLDQLVREKQPKVRKPASKRKKK